MVDSVGVPPEGARYHPYCPYHHPLMKKHLPLEQQFELMDLRIAQVIEELDSFLDTSESPEDTADPQDTTEPH